MGEIGWNVSGWQEAVNVRYAYRILTASCRLITNTEHSLRWILGFLLRKERLWGRKHRNSLMEGIEEGGDT